MIALAAATSDTIAFWGTINSVRPAPCAWSGIHVATIEVEYQVVQVLAGTPGSTVTVEHAVVEAPDTCATPLIYALTEPLLVKASLVTGFSRGPIYPLEEEKEGAPTDPVSRGDGLSTP